MLYDSMDMKFPEQASPWTDWLPAAGEGQEAMGSDCNGYKVSFLSDKNILKLIMMMDTQLCEYTKSHLSCIV